MAAARRLTLRILGALCVLLIGVVFGAGSASAALTHAFVSSFGSFSGVEGVAVDHSSGDVYVYDAGAGAILKFDSTGNPVNFSSTGTNVIEGVGNAGEGEGQIALDNSSGPAKGDIYVANGTRVGVYSSAGKLLGELAAEAGRPWGTPCGVAVDSSGSVYVGLHGSRVNKYAPAGNPVVGGDYVGSLWGLSNACGVAVDGEGSVYVDSWPDGPVFKYEALQFNALETNASGSEVTGSGRAVAVDSTSNDLYVARYSEVAQFESTGAAIDSFSGSQASAFGNTHGLAVDASGNVLVSDNNQARIDIFGPIVELPDATITEAANVSTSGVTLKGTVNPNGVEVTSCEFEYSLYESFYNPSTVSCAALPGSGSSPVAVEAQAAGLSSHTVYYYRLTVANANGASRSQGAQFKTQSLPILESVWSTEVNRSTARINAAINPAGTDTTYRFEYGPDTSYGSSFPVPDGDLGAADERVEVSHFLSGLQQGSSYHFRVVATSSIGTTASEDQTFTTFVPPAPEPADTCPNAAYRTGASRGLPDCRAYEMVSPVDKNGGEVAGEAAGQVFASEWGDRAGEADRVVFMSKTPFGAVKGSGLIGYTHYLAERGPSGWSTHGITPTTNTRVGGQVFFGKTDLKEFSSDLSVAALIAYELPEGPATARPNSENDYLEDTTTGKAIAAITDASHEGEPGFSPTDPFAMLFEIPTLGAGSSSLDVVTFMSRLNYLPEAKGNEYKMYAYEHGVVKLVGVLPDGSTPPGGSTLASQIGSPERGSLWWKESAIEDKDTVSADGSRILFEVPEFPNQLFMRKDGSTSVLVSESETAAPVTAENVQLEAATPDLKHIVFHTTTRLIDGAPEDGGLYMYTDSVNPKSESNLTYIGADAHQTQGTSLNDVLGISEDGTHIYYVASNSSSIDLWDAGQTRQIAPASGVAVGYLTGAPGSRVEARVTPDGRQVAFMDGGLKSEEEGEVSEMYLYKEDTNTLKCVSCLPSGTTPTVGIEKGIHVNPLNTNLNEPYRPRFMTRDGHYVFFNTPEALAAQDTNGTTDAYEYDTLTGKLSLLSTGAGEDSAWFVDAGADGHDVFLVTRQQLSGWDRDKLGDLYDVRVGGGFSEPSASGVPCDGDVCQGTPSGAPSFNTASGFTGLGNPSFSKAVSARAKAKPGQRLRRALAACRKEPKRKRARCQRLARRRYGTGRSSVRNLRSGR
jgi:hypothetical protein